MSAFRGLGPPSLLRLGVVAVALVGLVAGCTAAGGAKAGSSGSASSGSLGPATYATAPCPSPNFPGVPQLDLGPEFTCGYLTVPENRAKPDGRTIKIAVATAKSTSPTPKKDPILYLTGGPGGTGLVTAVQRVADGWNADRDVIFIDQRGTFHSDPLLACPEIDAFAVTALGLSASSADAATASAAATKTCRDRLAGQGYDLSAYNTAENVADVAQLRTAMGIDEWNVYGVSYGTDLALQLLRDHPAGIRSLVLDSLVPPQVNLVDAFWPNAAQGFRALFDACAAQPACASAYPNLEAEFTTLVSSLSTTPRTVVVTGPDGTDTTVVIDGYTLANLVVVASLVPGTIAKVPALIHDLATGSGTLAAQALLGGVPPSGVTGYGLALGVFCGEQLAFTTREKYVAEAQAALPGYPEAALGLLPQTAHLVGDCAAWDMPKAAAAVRQPTKSDVPVLLIDGELDAITPPALAATAAKNLPNSTTMLFPGAGHDVMIWSPKCAVASMLAFLAKPGGDFDQSCLDAVTAPAFATA